MRILENDIAKCSMHIERRSCAGQVQMIGGASLMHRCIVGTASSWSVSVTRINERKGTHVTWPLCLSRDP